jgi:WD40 repeat protein
MLHTNTVFALATLQNGNLASSSGDTSICIWNPNTGSILYTLTGHTGSISYGISHITEW